ncbi:MAG: hypothetical protein K2L55_01710, partial [Muribaculaceae bacterium]|nr:hypothetical protein [Muribaculaceae bacterium]
MIQTKIINDSYTAIYVGGGNFITENYPTNFHTFITEKRLLPSDSIDNYKEVTAAQRSVLEAADAKWVRPPQAFIDQWNAACSNRFVNSSYYKSYGRYNEATGFFVLNGITDISYAEAVRIYMAYVSGRTTTGYRTNIPVGMANYQDAAAEIRMFTNTEVEKIYGSFSATNAEVLNTGKLREINSIRLGYGSNSVNIRSTSLEIIYFSAQNKLHYPCKINISNAAKFRLDGIAQIVDWVNDST